MAARPLVASASAFLPQAHISKRHLPDHGGTTVFGWERYPNGEKCRVATDNCFRPPPQTLACAAAPAPRAVGRLVHSLGGGRAAAGSDDRPAPRRRPGLRERLWPVRGRAD